MGATNGICHRDTKSKNYTVTRLQKRIKIAKLSVLFRIIILYEAELYLMSHAMS